MLSRIVHANPDERNVINHHCRIPPFLFPDRPINQADCIPLEVLLPELEFDLLHRDALRGSLNLPRRRIRPAKVHSDLGGGRPA